MDVNDLGRPSSVLSLMEVAEVATMLSGIWMNRNGKVHGSAITPAKLINRLAKQSIMGFYQARASPPLMHPGQSSCISARWPRPPPGMLKINVDMAIKDPRVTSAGAIMCDELGQLIQAVGENYTQSVEPAVGEALAVLFGLGLAMEKGGQQIVIESDPQAIINTLRNGVGDLSVLGSIIDDCVVLMRSFTKVLCSWVHKELSRTAHEMASFSVDCHRQGGWSTILPTPIFEICNGDVEQ